MPALTHRGESDTEAKKARPPTASQSSKCASIPAVTQGRNGGVNWDTSPFLSTPHSHLGTQQDLPNCSLKNTWGSFPSSLMPP